MNGSQDYDLIYRDSDKYNCHYSISVYYPLWRSALKYISGTVAELGCGTGQFAHLLRSFKDVEYTGYDFSDEAILKAKKRNPKLTFINEDITKLNLKGYDVIVAFEFLEHIKDDIELTDKFSKGQKIVFSLPSFMARLHYRCFESEQEIKERYKNLDILNIETFKFIRNKAKETNTYYLCYARKL